MPHFPLISFQKQNFLTHDRNLPQLSVNSPFTHTQKKRLELRDDNKKGISHCSKLKFPARVLHN